MSASPPVVAITMGNPAGVGGLLGREEIAPAVRDVRRPGVRVAGPMSPGLADAIAMACRMAIQRRTRVTRWK